jgi:haloacetate dehalogenase
MGAENHDDFLRAIRDPAVVHGMVEDYRAGLGIDRAHDNADKSVGRKLACPMLFLWSSDDDMVELYGDPLAIWRAWASDLRGFGIDSGHHIAEEAPGALADALIQFFARSSRPTD